MNAGKGYRGLVTLRSPNGDQTATIKLAGRVRSTYGGLIPAARDAQAKIAEKRFQRLLSQGWKISLKASFDQDEEVDEEASAAEEADDLEEGVAGEEDAKDTDEVNGATQQGNKSHGGKHASKEVKNSENAADGGTRSRGCRAGRSAASKAAKQADMRKAFQEAKASKQAQQRLFGKHKGSLVADPQPFRLAPEVRSSCEGTVEILAEVIGKASQKLPKGTNVDLEGLLLAFETGEDPLPYLERPRVQRKSRVLVTPDCSRSCANWSGTARAWAKLLAEHPDVEVEYTEVFDQTFRWDAKPGGPPRTVSAKTQEFLADFDVLIYLGDHAGEYFRMYAELGLTVICLEANAVAYMANGKPRIRTDEFVGEGRHFRVDRVAANDPATWQLALLEVSERLK